MIQKTVEYGTTHPVEVDSASARLIAVIATDIKEGFLLVNHGMGKLPNKGDKGKIVFERGGPLKGHWKFYKD